MIPNTAIAATRFAPVSAYNAMRSTIPGSDITTSEMNPATVSNLPR